MDGARVRQFMENEVEAMLKTYEQFQILIPAEGKNGAAHPGEDGIYVEALLKGYIEKFLPKGLEVLTGFILRPAVKTGKGESERRKDADTHSSQLDLIIYDSASYPVFLRMENHVIVPPEGVIGVISVKKNLYFSQVDEEIKALEQVGQLCTGKNAMGQEVKGPFLALVEMDTAESGKLETQGKKMFERLEKIFAQTGTNRYDWFPGYIGVLNQWSVYKAAPKKADKEIEKKAKYCFYKHKKSEKYLGFSLIINGILNVYYDKTRGNERRLGFALLSSGRGYDEKLGEIPYQKEHGDRKLKNMGNINRR